jgi:uncharacterized membrane protein YdbT with pleckstrin-like domain
VIGMNYVQKVLQPGEAVAYTTTLHPLVYADAGLALLVSLLLLAVSLKGMWATETGWAALGFLALAGLLALRAWIRRVTTELAITDRRVIFKTGVLRRHTLEMNLSKIESVGVFQSIFSRIFGYGRIEIKGTGQSFIPEPFISDPLGFRSHITAG